MTKGRKNFNRQRIEDALNKILQYFQTGQMPKAIARSIITTKEGIDIPSLKWSLGNQLIMFASGTTDARGYKQWQRVGRYPRKGSKAIYILAPSYKKIRKSKKGKINDNDIEKIEKLEAEEQEEQDEEEKYVISGFLCVPVFRYEDTEGEPLKYQSFEPPVLPPLIEVAEKYGVDVTYFPLHGNFLGRYNKKNKNILLCTHDIDVFFHELAHVVHGSFRNLKSGQHVEQEVVAETVAAVLCELYDHKGYICHSYDYIVNLTKGKNSNAAIKEIMKVTKDIQKVLELILLHDNHKKSLAAS